MLTGGHCSEVVVKTGLTVYSEANDNIKCLPVIDAHGRGVGEREVDET